MVYCNKVYSVISNMNSAICSYPFSAAFEEYRFKFTFKFNSTLGPKLHL